MKEQKEALDLIMGDSEAMKKFSGKTMARMHVRKKVEISKEFIKKDILDEYGNYEKYKENKIEEVYDDSTMDAGKD